MPNGKDGLYVTRNQQQQNDQIPGGWQVMEQEDVAHASDWNMVEKEESTYQTEYRKHMQMQDKLAAEKRYNKRGQEIEDGAEMLAVKRDMAAVTARLEEGIPEDISDFRAKLLDTTTLYDNLIESCKTYLKNHGGYSSDAKRRGKMVTEIRDRAIAERRCFANLGASDHIHKDREEGMILGNVLGNYAVLNKIIDVRHNKYEDYEDTGRYLAGLHTVYDNDNYAMELHRYTIGKQKNKLDKDLAHAHVASTLTKFLGVGELLGDTDLVSIRKSENERYFGIKYRGRVNIRDKTYREIVEESRGNKVDIVYSNEALRQMSIIQMLLALFGGNNIKAEDNIRMIGDEQETCYRVSHVYLDLMQGVSLFEDDIDGKSLEKKKGSLPAFDKLSIPLLDKEFSTAILAMRAEDIGILAGTLISSKERKAFESRLTHLQKLIKERIKQDEKLPSEEKTILSKEEWMSQNTSEKLQDKLWRGNPQFCPEILGRNKVLNNKSVVCHVEGAQNGADFAMKQYQEMYFAARSALLAKKNGMERYLALTDLLNNDTYNYNYVYKLKEEGIKESKAAAIRREMYGDVIRRLLDEFTSPELIKAHYTLRMEMAPKLKKLYDEMNSKVKEIPKELLREDSINAAISSKVENYKLGGMAEELAKEKATASIQKKVREQYIWACIKKENPEIFYDLYRFQAFQAPMHNALLNRQYNPAFRYTDENMVRENKKFQRNYDKIHGAGAFDSNSKYVVDSEVISLKQDFFIEEFSKDFELVEKRLGNTKAEALGVDINDVPENPVVQENQKPPLGFEEL